MEIFTPKIKYNIILWHFVANRVSFLQKKKPGQVYMKFSEIVIEKFNENLARIYHHPNFYQLT